MYELTINTDTFFLTSAFYYDKACEHPCPTIVPLVQGLAGTLRVHFVGELAPEAKDSCLFAIRPYRGVDDLYRTEYANGQVDEDGDVYFDIDLNVSTAELVGALTGREVLDVKAGFVVVNDDQSVRREFQSSSTISKTVLAQNETAPLPRATAQSEADYYAGKYVSEWLWCGGIRCDIENTVSEHLVPIESDISELCSKVTGLCNTTGVLIACAANHVTLDTQQTITGQKTFTSALAMNGCNIARIQPGTSYASLDGSWRLNTNEIATTNALNSAIGTEISNRESADAELQASIDANAKAISENADAINILEKQQYADETAIQTNASDIASLQTQLATDETAISQNTANIEALQNSLADYATVEALSEETTRATDAENALQTALNNEISNRTSAENDMQYAIDSNKSAICSLQKESSSYVTLNSTQTIGGWKVFICGARLCGGVYLDSTYEVSIAKNTTNNYGCLKGSWRYRCHELATVLCLGNEIDDRKSADAQLCNAIASLQSASSNYVTLTGSQTISGGKTFTGMTYFKGTPVLCVEVFVASCHNKISMCESSYADLKGCWRLNGEEIAAGTNYVTLGDAQTITGSKTFTQAIFIGSSSNTEIQIQPCSGYGNLKGGWRLNGACFALKSDIPAEQDLSNYVTLDGMQTISGQKTFTSTTTICRGFNFGTCEIQIALDKACAGGGNYGNLQGEWKLNGEEIALKGDIPDVSVYAKASCLDPIKDCLYVVAQTEQDVISCVKKIGTEVSNLTACVNSAASSIAVLQSQAATYVTLSGQQTISGDKAFSAPLTLNSGLRFCLCDIMIARCGAYGQLYGSWRLNGEEIATVSDIPDVSKYATIACVQNEKNARLSTEQAICSTITSLRTASANYVTLDDSQTISGAKTFSGWTYFKGTPIVCGNVFVGSCDNKIMACGSYYAALSGSWKLNGSCIATMDNIPNPDLSDYVTKTTLTTGQFTVSGEWHFDGEVQMSNNNYTFDLQEGVIGGTWKMSGKTIATLDDIPDTSNFVALSGDQTISGYKTFKGYPTFCDGIHFGNRCDVVIKRCDGDGYGHLYGGWKLNYVELATKDDIPDVSNYVTLDSQQTIKGIKFFSCRAIFTGTTSTEISISPGYNYANLLGCWRLKGKSFAMADDVVMLSGDQTISGYKTFKSYPTFCDGIHFGNRCDVVITRCSDGYGHLVGSWKMNGTEFAPHLFASKTCLANEASARISTEGEITDTLAELKTASANHVTLNGVQTITGQKTFSQAATFNDIAIIAGTAYIGSCGLTMGRNTGGDYVCLTGTWRLKGADISTRDITDALDARITALEAKVG